MPRIRDAVVKYLQLENDFITELIRRAKQAHDQSGTSTGLRPDWDNIQKRFNDQFEGKMLECCSVRRIHRSKSSIKTHADRLPSVAEIRGKKVRKDAEQRGRRSGRAKGKGKAKDEDDEEDEDGEDSDEVGDDNGN